MIGGFVGLRLDPADPVDQEEFENLKDRVIFYCVTKNGLRKMEKLLTSDTDVMDCETKELTHFKLIK